MATLAQLQQQKFDAQAEYQRILLVETHLRATRKGETTAAPGGSDTIILTCPAGQAISRYSALYGVEGTTCGRYCTLPVIGEQSASFWANAVQWGDPCPNVPKYGYLDIWCKRPSTHPDLIAITERIAGLDEQITQAMIEEQLRDQFNILREESDRKVAAIRAEAEAIISEIRVDYAQRDENVRTEADAKVMAARAEAEAMVQAVQAQAELTAEELRLDYARRDELIRAEAEAKIEAATAEERAIIRAETDAELAQYTTDMNAEIIAIKNTADAKVEQAKIDAGNEIKDAQANADAMIVKYREQTDAEIARIKAEAEAEIERARAEAEAKMETLKREAGIVPTIAPELAKWLPLLLVGGYMAVTGKPEKGLAKKK